MITQDQLKSIQKRTEALKGYLNIEDLQIEVDEEEQRTQLPDFWNDSKAAEKLLKQIRNKKVWTDGYKSVQTAVDDTEVLYEFYKEEAATAKEVEAAFGKALVAIDDLEFKNMLSAEEDSLSAVLQITSGAGGTES